MEFPDDFFKDKLYNSEADYSENVSFDKVMDRRRKKRRLLFWWNPKTYATLGVLFLGGLTAFVTHSFNGKSNNSNIVDVANVSNSNLTSNQTNKKEVQAELSKKNQFENETVAASKIVKTGFNKSELSFAHSYHDLAFKKGNKIKQSKLKSVLNHSNSKLLNQLVLEKSLNNQSKIAQSNLTNKLSEESTFGKSSILANEDIYNLSKWNDRISSAKPKQNHFGFDGLKLYMSDLEFELPDFEIKLRNTPSKWFAELSAITGSNNTIVFEDDVPLSVLGTQYMAQYQMLVLKDFENGSMFGAGIQFSEWVGNGKWQRTSNSMVPKVTTRKVLISPPWEPKKYAVLSDTTYVPVTTVQSGAVEYKIDKISFPLAYRFCTSIGKLPVRFGMHLAPGYTTVTEGVYFTQTDFRPIQSNRQMTVDGRITLGPMFPITKKWTFVMEPSLIYQSFVTPDNQVNGKFFTGLGVAILRQF
jgi:hypothetical protein